MAIMVVSFLQMAKPVSVAAETCQELKDKASTLASTSQNENLDGDTGTTQLAKCVKLSQNNMRYLYGDNHRPEQWTEWVNSSDECIAANPVCKADQTTTEIEKAAATCKKQHDMAATCDGAAFIINEYGRDWTSPENTKPPVIKGGTPEITCKAQGIATLDYDGCAKFVQNSSIMDAAQGAIQTGQNMYYQDQAQTAQMKAAASPETATAGLQALQTGVKGQQDIMTQRAALDTGKFAALASYYAGIPSASDLQDKCANYHPKNETLKNGCTNAVTRQDLFAFLQNQTEKDKMKAKLVGVGINVASDAVMADLMAKRANDISNAIANVNSFKPIDPLAPATTNVQSTYCQQNPGDPKCLTGGLDRTFSAMGDNTITFGDGGTGTTYTNTNPNLDPGAGASNAINPTAGGVTSVGNIITPAQQKGGVADIAAAATIGKGTPPAGGGGGGSSGGGGGGGGGAPAAGTAGGASSAIAGKAPSYGGGGGTLSMMGGLGSMKAKTAAKDDGNPFGKLFNKDTNKSGAIDFGRSPTFQKVGNKTDNIFDMISKRYTNVSNDKRLIEYEIAK